MRSPCSLMATLPTNTKTIKMMLLLGGLGGRKTQSQRSFVAYVLTCNV